MADNDDQAGLSQDEIVVQFRIANRQRVTARRVTSLLLLIVVGVNIGLMYKAMRNFTENQLGEFAQAMNDEAALILPPVAEEVTEMANRLYPHYVSVFQTTFEKDWNKVRQRGLDELNKLDIYAQGRWPDIDNGVEDLLITSSESFMAELSKSITPDEAEKLSAEYGKALTEKYESLAETTFRPHMKIAEEIGESLERINETEPDIQPPIGMTDMLGALLELIGIELQSSDAS